MGSKKIEILLVSMASLITTLIVFLAVSLLTNNEAVSFVPGWHTTIYPPEITWTILTILILVTSLLVNLIFRGTIKLLTTLRARLK